MQNFYDSDESANDEFDNAMQMLDSIGQSNQTVAKKTPAKKSIVVEKNKKKTNQPKLVNHSKGFANDNEAKYLKNLTDTNFEDFPDKYCFKERNKYLLAKGIDLKNYINTRKEAEKIGIDWSNPDTDIVSTLSKSETHKLLKTAYLKYCEYHQTFKGGIMCILCKDKLDDKTKKQCRKVANEITRLSHKIARLEHIANLNEPQTEKLNEDKKRLENLEKRMFMEHTDNDTKNMGVTKKRWDHTERECFLNACINAFEQCANDSTNKTERRQNWVKCVKEQLKKDGCNTIKFQTLKLTTFLNVYVRHNLKTKVPDQTATDEEKDEYKQMKKDLRNEAKKYIKWKK